MDKGAGLISAPQHWLGCYDLWGIQWNYWCKISKDKENLITGLGDLNQDAVKINFTDESVQIRIQNYKEIDQQLYYHFYFYIPIGQ